MDVFDFLSHFKRHAVGALILRGIGLVGTDRNAVQDAVILIGAMIFTIADGAFDTAIGFTTHNIHLL